MSDVFMMALVIPFGAFSFGDCGKGLPDQDLSGYEHCWRTLARVYMVAADAELDGLQLTKGDREL